MPGNVARRLQEHETSVKCCWSRVVFHSALLPYVFQARMHDGSSISPRTEARNSVSDRRTNTNFRPIRLVGALEA
jgi:hypothetical protein